MGGKSEIFIGNECLEILDRLDSDWNDFWEKRVDMMWSILNIFKTFCSMQSAKLPVNISNENIDNVKKEYVELFKKYFWDDKKGTPPVLLALLIESFNSLSHAHEKNNGLLYTECMVGKDFLINKLAQLCISKKGFDLGFRCGLNEDKKRTYYDKVEKKRFFIPTFEIDIPGIGHLAWHLGNKQRAAELRKYVADVALKMKLVTLDEEDKKKFKDRAGLEEAFFRYPDAMMNIFYPPSNNTQKNETVKRRRYSNLDLLKGENSDKYSEADKVLRNFCEVASRHKKIEEFYGIKKLERKVKKITPSH